MTGTDIALVEKLANLGALGILLALAVVFLVRLGERLLKVFEDRIKATEVAAHERTTAIETMSRERTAFLETGVLRLLADIADRNAEHDRKSAEAHQRQDSAAAATLAAIERIERKVS